MKQVRTLYMQAVLAGGILLLLNLFAQRTVLRYDLSDDGRYSLNPVSLATMDSLRQQMTVKVYLEGAELPARVKRFRDATRTLLQELQAHAGSKLVFEFIDPSQNQALQQKLVQQGVPAIPIIEQRSATEMRQQFIFPGAVLNFDGKEEVVNLLFNDCVQRGQGLYDCDYAKAEGELEYKLISQMQRMLPGQRRIVGLVQSHGCLPQEKMKEWMTELGKFYQVIPVDLRKSQLLPVSPRLLPDTVRQQLDKDALGYDVLVLPKPTQPFAERDKYILDQYIMMGGRVLWLVDQEEVDELDFASETASSLSILRRLNLDDQFFRYGFRIATDLIEAAPHPSMAGPIEVVMNLPGNQQNERGPRPVPAPYPYYPLIIKAGMPDHPITRSLETVKLHYASSLDTLATPGIRHQPLLRTSPYSRSREGAILINLQRAVFDRPPRDLYLGKGERLVGLALAGTFPSVFRGRRIPDSLDTRAPTINNTVMPNRMVVFSDGDLPTGGRLRYTGTTAIPANNKQLLMNALDWLIDDKSFLQIHARNVQIPRLDLDKVQGNSWYYQGLNLLLPLLLVVGLGLLRAWRRRRRNQAYRQPA
ncbi:MAG: Gldg family protein [Bacteroidetes bacterium]|jgi:ABC-2 type transport system permease protein|nr:Gldg family protein [Bacteroidota bacterium]